MNSVFPLKFDKCPCCGSTKRVIEEQANAEIEKGDIRPGVKVPVMVSQTPICDIENASKIIANRPVRILVGYYDVCAECGTMYLIEMVEMEGMLGVQQQTPPRRPKFSQGGGLGFN